MNLNFNQKKSFDCSGKTVSGVQFVFNLTHTTANTAFTGNVIDTLIPTIKVELARMGKKFTLVNEQLFQCTTDSSFFSAAFKFSKGSAYQILVAAASGVKEVIAIPMTVDFGGVINLIGADNMNIEAFIPASCAASTVDTSVSNIDVNEVESTGFELYTPYIQTKSVDPGASTFRQSWPERVLSVSFMNADKTDILNASKVLSNAQVTSNFANISDVYTDLLAKREQMLPDPTVTRAQCFFILPFTGLIHSDCTVNCTLVAANVNASKNVFVFRAVYTDERLAQRAEANKLRYQAQVRNNK